MWGTLKPLYQIEGLPTFQNRVFATREEAQNCAQGTMRLEQDQVTGLIHNAAFDPAKMVYDENYQNEQANSGFFREHLAGIADLVVQQLGTGPLVEVGCGKGYFLEMLAARGCSITGCDPAYEGADPAIIKQYFSADLGLAPRSGLILRHVLEHIEDPIAFLGQLRDANQGGLIYIEVPCFDWILEHRAWFDIFYEHVNYFRLDDFRRAFGRVVYAQRSFGGQYLSVIADLATLHVPTRDDTATLPDGFLPNLDNAPADAVIWGGGSKGVIFSIAMQRAGHPVSAAIDINPLKQGRYLPVSGVPVMAPEAILPTLTDATTIYVMNGNYLAEIAAQGGPRFRYIAIDGSQELR